MTNLTLTPRQLVQFVVPLLLLFLCVALATPISLSLHCAPVVGSVYCAALAAVHVCCAVLDRPSSCRPTLLFWHLGADFPIDPSFPRWLRYACHQEDEDTLVSSGAPLMAFGATKQKKQNVTMKLLPRPHQLEIDRANDQRVVFVKAVKLFWSGHASPKPSEAACLEALDMMLCEEAVMWKLDFGKPSKHFLDALCARAAVITADNQFKTKLVSASNPSPTAQNLKHKISTYEEGVEQFFSWKQTALGKKSAKKFPVIKNASDKLRTVQKDLAELRANLLEYTSFANYKSVALNYELVGILQFCMWCAKEVVVVEGILSSFELR